MGKSNKILVIIAIWQVLIACFALTSLIDRAQTHELIINRVHYFTQDMAIKSFIVDAPTYPGYYQKFKDIEHPVTSIYLMLLAIIAIASCIGLLLRKNWGWKTSISTMVMTILFFFYSITSLLLYTEAIEYNEILNELIWPIFISQAVIVVSIFSIIYINKVFITKSHNRKH